MFNFFYANYIYQVLPKKKIKTKNYCWAIKQHDCILEILVNLLSIHIFCIKLIKLQFKKIPKLI